MGRTPYPASRRTRKISPLHTPPGRLANADFPRVAIVAQPSSLRSPPKLFWNKGNGVSHWVRHDFRNDQRDAPSVSTRLTTLRASTTNGSSSGTSLTRLSPK